MDKIIKDDEIDLAALFNVIWAGRKIIYYSIAICFVIGLIIAFTSPKKYTASATLLPSVEKSSNGLGGLSSLAGLAGINMNSMMGDASGIPAELYPQVVGSVPYLMELMNEKFCWEEYDNPMSFLDVVKDKSKTKESLFLKYTIKLPWTIKEALSGNKNDFLKDKTLSDSVNFLNLSSDQLVAIALIKEALSVENDKKSGLITLTVTSSESLLTAQIADKAVSLLQKYVIRFKTKQSVEKFEFIEARCAEIKEEYETSRNKLLYYKDVHRNMVNERIDNEYQRLSDAYDMSSAVYKGLMQQLEQARITVKEETPVFSILDPVLLPLKAKSKLKLIVVSLLGGGILGVLLALGLHYSGFFRKLIKV